MPNLTEPAIILIQPVEERLGKRHERSTESDNWRARPINGVGKVDIGQVEESLNDIHES
jgi:hypothetical protein